jgi:hypothetical protein
MNIRRRYKAKRRRKEAKKMADLRNKMRGRGHLDYSLRIDSKTG